MAKRSYRQFCAMARALDVVGERWTLLLVRELLAGPRRYTDLLDGLPGIGTNLLASRLRELEEAGIVEKGSLPPPASSMVYSLTERGQGLRSVLMQLGKWGDKLTAAPEKTDAARPWWALLLLNGRFEPTVPGVAESYELHAGGEVLHLEIGRDGLTMGQGSARDPAVTLTTDVDTIVNALAGKMSLGLAIARGRASFAGDAKALQRMEKLFAPRPPFAR